MRIRWEKGWILLVAGLVLSELACESKPEEPAPAGTTKKRAPVPTTAPHRRPLPPGKIKALEALVAKQLQEKQPELSKACWPSEAAPAGSAKPAAGKPGEPPLKSLKEMMANTATITYEMIYDAEGKQIARSLGSDPSTGRPEVTKCLEKIETATTIPATGRKVQIKVQLKFP